MADQLKTIKVTILGKSYTLSTDDNEQDILTAVKLVDNRMREIANVMATNDGHVAAVLLALELAGELKKQEKDLSLWREKAFDLSSLLTSKLA